MGSDALVINPGGRIGGDRRGLLALINGAFGTSNIAATALRILPLPPGADFLSICHELELLSPVLNSTLEVYRRDLAMSLPPLSQNTLTAAFRLSLESLPPIALQLAIGDGDAEEIEVRTTRELISVRLMRLRPTGPAP